MTITPDLLMFGVELEFGSNTIDSVWTPKLRYFTDMNLLTFDRDSSVYVPGTAYGTEWKLGVFQAEVKHTHKPTFSYPLFASCLDAVLDTIGTQGRVNRTCGMHVHVSTPQGQVTLTKDQRHDMLDDVSFWHSRKNYVRSADCDELESHYSGIGVRDGLNHLEFRWPNGTLNKRGIHQQVQKCFRQFLTLCQ